MRVNRFGFFFIFFLGCSASRVVLNHPEFVAHPSLDFENVRFRRPETPLFDPERIEKEPEMDAAGNVLSGAPRELRNLDCERSEDFFSKLNLSAIRSCISSMIPIRGSEVKGFDLEWNLKKGDQPTLELRNPEDAPECVRSNLSEIPFPRELVYVVPSENLNRGECYTSRLALDSGDLLGWELPRSRIRLSVSFPLREKIKTDQGVERVLRAWILSIYRGGAREKEAFHGRFLPNRYCLRCLGIQETGDRGAATIPYPNTIWPSRGAAESVGWGSSTNL